MTRLEPIRPDRAALPRLPRRALCEAILSSGPPVCVIEGPAGTGKSVLLDLLSERTGRPVRRAAGPGALGPGLHLWDPPLRAPLGDLPADLPPGLRLILARRPDTPLPGLARARVYGRVATFGTADLLLTEGDLSEALPPGEAAEILRRTGGWACLLGPALGGRGPEDIEDFLRAEVLAPLPGPQLVALSALLAGRAEGAGPLLAGLPFVDPGRPLPLPAVLEAIRDPLARALAGETAARMTGVTAVRAIAMTRAALGDEPGAIDALQSVGAWEAALATLRAARGPFFVHRFGPAAFDRMLAGFPPELAQAEEVLVLCRAIQAAKRGEMPLTRRILQDRWGPEVADARAVLRDRGRWSLDLRFLRLLLCTWEDADLGPDWLEAGYELLAEIPADDDLRRGSFYNAMLEAYLRARRFAEAEHAAVRAAGHYARAGVPILSFYIDLHLGIIRLVQGDPQAARRFARQAGAHLARTPYESPGDARLLALLAACADFELGDGRSLGRFLSLDLDDLAQGEIWPSLLETILTYGTQALAEQYSTLAARGFLDRWRATGDRSRQVGRLIDQREAGLLQVSNRWLEAAALVERLAPPGPEPGPERLGILAGRDELGLALLRLRLAVREPDPDPALGLRLLALVENPHLTGRQRLAAELLRAQVLRRRGETAEALAQLQRTLSGVAQRGSVAALREERALLDDLLSLRRLADPLVRIEPIRRLLRRVSGRDTGSAPKARDHGLTRQETRILHLLCEGAANKTIAKAMALSEATVKFHLANLYRKLGCATRREAAAAASALGLVG